MTATRWRPRSLSTQRHRAGDRPTDGRLDRNFLAGARGDAINALLCGAGYNLRLILNYLRRLLRALLHALTEQRYAAAATG